MERAPVGQVFTQAPHATHLNGIGSLGATNIDAVGQKPTHDKQPTQVFEFNLTIPLESRVSASTGHTFIHSPH
jgi:hypothetical protein